eukprot:11223688-Lingulodinium_polyedra.AAC.1
MASRSMQCQSLSWGVEQLLDGVLIGRANDVVAHDLPVPHHRLHLSPGVGAPSLFPWLRPSGGGPVGWLHRERGEEDA